MKERAMQIIDEVLAYETARGEHASGTFSHKVLARIAELAPDPLRSSVETGCGKSTILFSQISERHTCYTVDDSDHVNSSLLFVRRCPLLRPENVRFVLGPTQLTMHHNPPPAIDLALIDGPHAYPFPEMEYWHIYPSLLVGGLLIVDDIHIPTIGRLYEFLREDEMFEPIEIVETTAFLRRTQASTFPPTWDCWDQQNFNRKRILSNARRDRHADLAHVVG